MAEANLTVQYRDGLLQYELEKLDLCVIEHALDAIVNYLPETTPLDLEDVRATWQKIGRILMDCELDYDDLKGGV